MLAKHGRKGRLVLVEGKLQTRRWRKDDEASDRFATEIMIVPGSRVQFLVKDDGSGMATGDAAEPPVSQQAEQDSQTADDIPF